MMSISFHRWTACGWQHRLINQTYTFRFTCPANPEYLIFTTMASDATANSVLQLDNISIAFQTKAFPLTEAPYKNLALFTDGNRILTVLGSIEADGDFDAGLLRWCDQDNYREWVPNTDQRRGRISARQRLLCRVRCAGGRAQCDPHRWRRLCRQLQWFRLFGAPDRGRLWRDRHASHGGLQQPGILGRRQCVLRL